MLESFKEETMSLLKEQVGEIKIIRKEAEIKDEQINFLKETIVHL